MRSEVGHIERGPLISVNAGLIARLIVLIAAAVGASAARAADTAPATSTNVAAQGKYAEPRMRATTLLNADVRNLQDKSLGKVHDLLIDLSRWELRYVIVESGGTFGVGGKLFAFPLHDFGAGRKPGQVVLNIDEQKLKSAPGFARDTQIGWGEYEDTLDRYFGIDQPASTPASRNLQLASQLIRASNVLDRNGAKAGTVVDIALNHGNGHIEYLFMQLDRGIDAHTRVLPLPPTAFYFAQSGGPPVLDIPIARLDTAFAFDVKRWPDINDPNYQQKVGVYLGRVTQQNPAPTPPNSDTVPTARDKPGPH